MIRFPTGLTVSIAEHVSDSSTATDTRYTATFRVTLESRAQSDSEAFGSIHYDGQAVTRLVLMCGGHQL